ncbi:YhcN/YlaJ family sporulation lipoprotein [Sporosarcina sp. FSL K6-1522]|uniref:YhcN/YlaJ family sporulation lipoprotein n=1 Tax=Sporosarcina sp. FSL K6-1522 TaxID=2921554 RepID=UPI003159D334
MKKILLVPAALLLILSLMGCGMNRDKDVKEDAVEKDATGTVTEQPQDHVVDKDTNTTHESKLEVADDAVTNILKLDEVESANVLVTSDNAYVGVVLKEGQEGTEQVENKIAEEVRAANANINNVYVSLNPDVAKQLTDYGDKIRAGEPVEGFFEEFSDTVRRLFPDDH